MIPGVLVLAALLYGMPRQARAIAKLLERETTGLPAISIFFSTLLYLAVGLMAVWAGTTFAPGAGLEAPFFDGILAGNWQPALRAQFLPGLLAGILSGLGILALYYGYFRPKIHPKKALAAERLRLEMGLGTRVLMGGVLEEIVFRWGVMGGLAGLLGFTTPAGIWAANLAAALAFAALHLPGFGLLSLATGLEPDPFDYWSSIALNVLLGLVFGWLFWRYGLLAAMLAHATVHIVWAPVERRIYNLEIQAKDLKRQN